jgi:hypothetical protein
VAASAYFTDSSYVRTILQLVNKQMGLTPLGLPIPYNVRLIQRTLQQPSVAKIVARVSLPALDCKLSRVRCLSRNRFAQPYEMLYLAPGMPEVRGNKSCIL